MVGVRSARPGAAAPGPRRALFACCSPDPELAHRLEARAVDVVSVPRASEIEARVAEWEPAFVVLDLDATGASEVALGLASSPARAARVVLLASAGTVFLAMKCLGARRAEHVIMKPADAEELASLLSRCDAAADIPRLPSLERIQWEYIHAVLGSCDGNVSEAARQLGIYRQSLQRMLRRHPPGR